MSLRLDFTKGTVKQDLAELPEKMLEAAYAELLQQAELMVGLAQVYVNVDTGSLRDSIRVERVAPSYHLHRTVRVRAGGYVTNPKTGKKVNYATYQELTHPYMRPAFEEIRANLGELIKRRVVEKINREYR